MIVRCLDLHLSQNYESVIVIDFKNLEQNH